MLERHIFRQRSDASISKDLSSSIRSVDASFGLDVFKIIKVDAFELDRSSDADTDAKADHQPDLPNRTGYWLGLNLVRQMRQQYSLREMASWPAAKAQAQARAALYEMTRGPGSGA